jgi:PAS domain S-box-containing protein
MTEPHAEMTSSIPPSTPDPLALAAGAAAEVLYAVEWATGALHWREAHGARFGMPSATGGLAWLEAAMHPDDAARVLAEWRSAAPSRVWASEFRLRRADGTWAVVADRGRAWLDAAGRVIGVVGGLRDVSDRHSAHLALSESEERYRLLVELSPDAVVVHVSGQVVYANQPAARLLGLAHPADLIGQPVLNAVHPASRDLVRSRLQTMGLGTAVPLVEEVFVHTDGSPIHVEVAASPTTFEGQPGILAVVRDIRARKRAEALIAAQKDELARAYDELRAHADRVEAEVATRTRELASQKALTERIIANAPAGLGFIDTQLVFRWLNPMLSRFLGFPPEALIGQPLFEVIPEVRDQFGPILQGVLDTGEPFRAEAAPFVYEVDGVTRTTYWDYAYMPVLDDEKKTVGLLVLNHEVSERVEQAQRLHDQIEQLHEVDRLKASFINTVTHELRTPLTSIMGYSEFLEDGIGGGLTPDQAEFVAQIQEGTRRLQRLVDDLLDFARLEAGTFQLVSQEGDLGALIRQEMASLLPQVRDGRLTLSLDLPEDAVKVRMDAPRIGQVLLNVGGNAVKFTRPGGRVTVALTREPDRVRVTIRDTGIGIPAEQLPHLFQKFYQVDPSATREFGGAGLGLSISRALVEAHGGEMGVESVEGEGSTFWFTLPA